jgi:hypothetical protein
MLIVIVLFFYLFICSFVIILFCCFGEGGREVGLIIWLVIPVEFYFSYYCIIYEVISFRNRRYK